jgi:alkaline phosphatase D
LDAKFPGLTNVFRKGDGDADRLRQPIDFHSPATFNYVVLDIGRDGRTLSADAWGIPAHTEESFPELAVTGAPRHILGHQIVDQSGKQGKEAFTIDHEITPFASHECSGPCAYSR